MHRRTFLKRVGVGAAGLGFIPFLPGCVSPSKPAHVLPRSTPEAQGVDSSAILAFLDAIAGSQHDFHSFMMVRRGHVIAEGWWTPYRAGANHMLYSLSKSFTSTAVGLAVSAGLFSVEDSVISFFPDELPSPAERDPNLAALKVKHLLTMSVGRAGDSMPIITKQHDWVRAFLALPIEHPPGSVFLYNSGATYMLSAIVQKVTGEKVIDYLRPRLFEPLEITGMTWETCPRGINTGGWGLSVPTEALAKFGQLYLQRGQWRGQQLIPARWVEEATTFKIQQPAGKGKELSQLKKTSDWHQGYCYQFWRCRHNAFRGDGAYGQFMIVMPEQEAVVAITCQTGNMQGELNLVWDHLLPGMREGTLPENTSQAAELRRRLHSLALPLAEGNASSSLPKIISGRPYFLEANALGLKQVSFEFSPQQCITTLTDDRRRNQVRCGMGKWVDGLCNIPGTPPKLTAGDLLPCKVAGSAAWTTDDELTMLWRYYETPHHDTVVCKFDGPTVTVEFRGSLPGHKETRPILRGHVA
jgi:CubicO group peptidase (beta-lactamase class C family)